MSIYQRLENLSFTRPSGTEEERAAAAFLKGELVQAGFQVEEESFTYQRQVPRLARLSALTDEGETVFPVTGIIDSAGTAEGGVQAPLLYLKSLDDVTLSQARGKIVLFHDRLGPEEYRRVLKAGAVATIATSGTIRDTLENSDLETGRFRDSLKPLGPIPGFTIRMTDAVKLLRLHPSSIRFELQLQEETVQSQNLVVTIPGTDLQDEIIVAGAHYDSVPFSKGSWDNGAGAVEIISLVEHLREAQPRRTVKCVLFGSEETGLQGSRAYVLRHQDEVPKTKVMINVDVGGSILGKEIVFVTAADEAETFVRQLLLEKGYAAVVTQRVMSSDCANFSRWGIPSISMGQGAPRGGGYMHTRYDNMDLIVPEVLEEESRWLYALVDRLAQADLIPFPRALPEKLQKGLAEYFGVDPSSLPKSDESDRPLPFRF